MNRAISIKFVWNEKKKYVFYKHDCHCKRASRRHQYWLLRPEMRPRLTSYRMKEPSLLPTTQPPKTPVTYYRREYFHRPSWTNVKHWKYIFWKHVKSIHIPGSLYNCIKHIDIENGIYSCIRANVCIFLYSISKISLFESCWLWIEVIEKKTCKGHRWIPEKHVKFALERFQVSTWVLGGCYQETYSTKILYHPSVLKGHPQMEIFLWTQIDRFE